MRAEKSVLLPQVLGELASAYPQFQLCYVQGHEAYFTSDLANQWGDDWNDAPLSCNAGTPYTPCVHYLANGTERLSPNDWLDDGTPRFQLIRLAFEINKNQVDMAVGPEISHYAFFSVEDLKAKKAPWLVAKRWDREAKCYGEELRLYAGASLGEFFEFLYRFDAKVLLPAGEIPVPYPAKCENPVFLEPKTGT